MKRRAGTIIPLIRLGFLNNLVIDQSYIKNRTLKPLEYNNVLAMFLMLLSVVFNPGGISVSYTHLTLPTKRIV